MKKTRRIAAFIAAMAMAACAVAPMMMTASATNVSIEANTADNAKDNASHTYNAYQIFTGTYNTNGLTINGWGTGYNSSGLLADANFRALEIPAVGTVGETGYVAATTVGDFIGSKTDAGTVAQAIEKMGLGSNSAQADALATILQKYIGSATATELNATPKDLAAGYWIVTDTYTATADANDTPANTKPDAISKYVLRVSGGTEAIKINPKKSYPTVVKKVQENTNVDDYTYTVGTGTSATSVTETNYNDVADYNIGDAVPFKLYGTLPSTYADYDHYYYLFTDTLGSQFTAPTSVTVKVVNPDGDDEDSDADETTLAANTDYTLNISGQVIKVEFMDTKKVSSITKDSVITVEYTAVLNNTANIGLDGQENKVDLEYSNNPYNTGNGSTKPTETDKTPEDKVIVFTYEQDIKKVDGATGAPLSAVFTLSKEVTGNSDAEKNGTFYVQVDTNGKVTGWTKTESDASELTTDETTGICKVIGLDDGAYTLKEKTAPEGYNAIDADMTLAIDATTANSQSWNGTASSALTGIALTASGDTHITDITNELTGDAKDKKGTVQAKVTNDKGINLPTTGGMGTVLFYTVGGVLVIGAGVVLVTKKRMGKED